MLEGVTFVIKVKETVRHKERERERERERAAAKKKIIKEEEDCRQPLDLEKRKKGSIINNPKL